jgi:hypothetical protein
MNTSREIRSVNVELVSEVSDIMSPSSGVDVKSVLGDGDRESPSNFEHRLHIDIALRLRRLHYVLDP